MKIKKLTSKVKNIPILSTIDSITIIFKFLKDHCTT